MGDTAQTTTTRMYASIRDQLASEITAGVYAAGALLPSIREIRERWEVSTTTARKVLDELAAAGYARKEGTRGAISTGGPQPGPAPAGEPARKAPPPAAVPGRLTVWPVHTIPAHGSVGPDEGNGLAALDVRAERPPADAAMALRITDPSRHVIVRRRLTAPPDNTPVQFRVSYIPAQLAQGTPIAQPPAIPDAWPAPLTTYHAPQVRLASSRVPAPPPNPEKAPPLPHPPDPPVLDAQDI